MFSKLECPYCHTTLSVREWNKNMPDSISLGVASEMFPEFQSVEEFECYQSENVGTRVDCPECGEAATLDDMYIY